MFCLKFQCYWDFTEPRGFQAAVFTSSVYLNTKTQKMLCIFSRRPDLFFFKPPKLKNYFHCIEEFVLIIFFHSNLPNSPQYKLHLRTFSTLSYLPCTLYRTLILLRLVRLRCLPSMLQYEKTTTASKFMDLYLLALKQTWVWLPSRWQAGNPVYLIKESFLSSWSRCKL